MPKLNTKQVKSVEQAEEWGDGFQLLPPGRYAAELVKVEEREGREYPQWSWEFTNIHDAEGKSYSGRLWHNTSMSPKALGNLKRTFKALGYTLDTDTDEMLGEWATLTVTKEVQTVGKKAGQEVNQVQAISDFDADEYDFDAHSVESAVGKTYGAQEDAAF